jgi:hypothetical protein
MAVDLDDRAGGLGLDVEVVRRPRERDVDGRRDITEQLKKANVEIDHRWIQMDGAIKALGKYEVPVKLSAGVVATLKFWVVGKDK